MRILFINTVCGIRSTGRICTDLAVELEKQGHEVKIAYGRYEVPEKFQRYAVRIGSDVEVKVNAIKARLLDNEGLNAVGATKKFLKWADEYNPDVLWLHNIHGYYLNYPLLFQWIKSRPQMQVKWTLHDCWSFTGHCTYFTMCGCEQWKTGCVHCPQKKEYPASNGLSCAKRNYELKKDLFTGIENMQLITPSRWLAELTRDTYLKDYPVEVVYNTVDKEIFHPVPSSFKEKNNISGKMILGVAAVWDQRKGLEDIIEIAEKAPEWTFVIVGIEERQLSKLKENMIGIKRTNNLSELVELYSAADVLFNPTYEDNYPTVNIEAKACGTPVVTYRTGGSPEACEPENVIECGNYLLALARMRELLESEVRA